MVEKKNTVLVKEIKEALRPEFEKMKIEIKDSLKPEFEAMKIEIKDSLKPEFKALNEKYDSLHETVLEFRRESFEHYDKIYNRLDFYKVEYHAITAGMKRIEAEHKIIDHKTILKEIQQLKSRN